MSEITVETKLKLMQQIQNRYQKNRNDLNHREQIVYGELKDYGAGIDEEEEFKRIHTFPLRLFLAIGLSLLIIASEVTGRDFAGIHAEDVYKKIAVDYQSSIATWANNTLKSTAEINNPRNENQN